MEDIRDLADKIKGLSDEELDAAIRSVGAAMGLDGRRIEKLAREKGTLKRKLENADERDYKKLSSMLTPDQIEAVKKSMEDR
ncbi:MAG: hypothetical protein IJR90_03770 [Clostridia bacterium]|nr:hypothetical protein [Clostridia bacterium]